MQTVSQILEWPAILSNLQSYCQTGYGRLLAESDKLNLPDSNTITMEMRRVQEAKTLINRYGDVQLDEPPDILPILQRISKQGEISTVSEMVELLAALKILRQLARFFIQNRSKEETPVLLGHIERIVLPNQVIQQLEGLVSLSGDLLDLASQEHNRLKLKIREKESSIRQFLQNLINNSSFTRYLQEHLITERENRLVLPVKAEHRNDVAGIVHSVSASGSTLYIEPRGVVEINNSLVALRSELEQEIRRILKQFSELLYPQVELLIQFINDSAFLDLIMAKARQSIAFKANPVEIVENPGIFFLRKARHPLLILQSSKSVVPNDIAIQPPHKVLLITGPNTGGKTVLLKTIGLFALMVQAGLHLPVAEGSYMSLFKPVLADIGDPQSITQNLSTFSGHIERLKSFLEISDLSKSLVLIDEICAGTDPTEGVALAQALLAAFYAKDATLVVTTHMGELKILAHKHEEYQNASVEFDTESLRPTYRLILGVPGSSNALNVAARLGLPLSIVDSARGNLSQPSADAGQLIESLEIKNRKLAMELEETSRIRQIMQQKEEQIRNRLDTIEGEKKKTIQIFKESLRDRLRNLEHDIDDLKKQIQLTMQSQEPSPLHSGKLEKQLRKSRYEIAELLSAEEDKLYSHDRIEWKELKIGSRVESRSLNMLATVVEKHEDRKELTIEAGILKTIVTLSDIAKIVGQPETKKSNSKKSSSASVQSFSGLYLDHDCDVRGMVVEDALQAVEKFLDKAVLSGCSSVCIIHGLGTGALKKAIRSYLKGLNFVKSFGPASASEGGDGKTEVFFK